MRIPGIAALVAATAVTILLATPSEAAKRKRTVVVEQYGNPALALPARRHPTRITVRRRSYLDPGTAVKPGDEHDTDYAFPPNHFPLADRTNYNFNSERMPIPSRWDIPGWPKF